MKQSKRVQLVPAIAVALFGAAWWILTRPQKRNAETQTNDPWRDTVDELVTQNATDGVCYNVMYTAALYATNPLRVTLDTETRSSKTNTVPVREWLLLKKRKTMMHRALTILNAPPLAFETYEKHRTCAMNSFNK
jgi:hypothetical protein